MRLFYRIRARYDEPYRIRNGWGLSPIRSERELKALMDFCASWLARDYAKLNLAKSDVLRETLELYHTASTELYDYINEHVEYYWD